MGVRQELVRVSVRAVDMVSFFFGSPPSAASGVSGGQAHRLCSGGPKSYVLAFRLASVASERTAVVWLRPPRRASVVGAYGGQKRHHKFVTSNSSSKTRDSLLSKFVTWNSLPKNS